MYADSYALLTDFTFTHNNLLLMGFDFAKYESEYGAHFTTESFKKSNPKAMASILHFLISKVFDEESTEAYHSCYFPRTTNDFQQFREITLTFLQKMSNKGIIPADVTLSQNLIDLCYGEKFQSFMRACTEGVMEYILNKEEYTDLPKVKSNNIDVALYATNAHISSAVSHILSIMKSGITAQNVWKNAAESVNSVYNKVLKAKEIEKKRSKLLADKNISEDQYKFGSDVSNKLLELSTMLESMMPAVEHCNGDAVNEPSIIQIGDGKKIAELDGLVNAATLKLKEWASK